MNEIMLDVLYFLVRTVIAIILAVIATKVHYLLYAMLIAPFRRAKCLKNKSYHQVTGENITTKATQGRDNLYRYIFRITVNGKKYRIWGVTTEDGSAVHMQFYYIKNPRGAVPDLNDIGNYEYSLRLGIILSIVFVVIANLLF